MIVGSRSNGDKSKRFYNAHLADHPDRSSRSDGHDMFETVHDGPFHRNRRSKRSDGYTQNLYKRRGSSTIVTIRVGIQSN